MVVFLFTFFKSSLDAEQTSQHPRVPTFLTLENLKVSSTIDHLLRAVDACSTTEEIRDHAVEREPGSSTGGIWCVAIGYSPLPVFFLKRQRNWKIGVWFGCIFCLVFQKMCFVSEVVVFPVGFLGPWRAPRHFWLLRYAGHETEMWFQLLCAVARDGVISTTSHYVQNVQVHSSSLGKTGASFWGMNKMD